MISIRRTSDTSIIRWLDGLCFGLDVPTRTEGVWWLACDGDKAVAYAGLRLQASGEKAFLCRAGVLPGYRGKGLQKRLVDARVAFARKAGCSRVWTYVSIWNFASMSTLTSRGFKPYYAQHQAEPPNAFLYLQKVLTKP